MPGFIKGIQKTEAGFFNVWVEYSRINGSQKRIVTKYNFHKWCLLRIVRLETDLDKLGA